MENLSEYKDFWSEIRSQITSMRALASIWNKDQKYIKEFEIPIEPTVPEKLINQFELRNKIEMPLSYKSYLLYFGAAGASDFNGTNNFVDKIYNADVSIPSSLEIFEGPVDIDHDEDPHPHPIESGDGTVEIARGFNPSVPFLVLNGEASGYVYWWNFGDMVGGLGEFAVWYKRWADKTLAAVQRRHTVFSTPAGTTQQELWDMFPGELQHEEIDDLTYLYHTKTKVAFTFDAKGNVKSSHIRSQLRRVYC